MNRFNPQGDELDPEPDAFAEAARPSPPKRPVPVEFAAAVLVVSGAFGLIQKVANPLVTPTGAFDPILVVAIALDLTSIAAGVLLRRGRTWVLAANVAAVFAFLYLTLLNPFGIAFGTLYLFVVVAAVLSRGWFAAMSAWNIAASEARLSR